jgi:hypothetical protein
VFLQENRMNQVTTGKLIEDLRVVVCDERRAIGATV